MKNFSWCHSEKDKNGQLKSLSWGANFFAQNIESGLNISTTVIGAYSVNVIIYYPNRFRCIPAVVMEDAKDTKKILDFKKLFKFLYLALRASALQGSNLPRCTSLPQLEPIQCYFHTKRKGFDYCSVGKITFLCWTFKTSSRHSVSFHVLQSIHSQFFIEWLCTWSWLSLLLCQYLNNFRPLCCVFIFLKFAENEIFWN